MYEVYVLKNIENKTYIGQTSNLAHRIIEHNAGNVRSTASGKPWTIVYSESFATRAEAMRREKELKTGKGRDYIKRMLEKRTKRS